MSGTQHIFKWKDIEIFGTEVPNFAAHSQSIFISLIFGHLGILIVFTLALIWVLFGYYKLGQQCFENRKFRNIFTFLLTPAAILTCLSGAYLYFVSTVIYSSDPNLFMRATMYIFMAILYFSSVIYIFMETQPKKSRVIILSFALLLSSVFLCSSYFGVNYG